MLFDLWTNGDRAVFIAILPEDRKRTRPEEVTTAPEIAPD